MFDRHQRRAVVLFAAADILLTVLAFEGAYQTRVWLPLPNVFFIHTPIKALLLGVTLLLWLAMGRWLGVYGRLYAANARAAVFDTFAQVSLGTLGLIAFMFALQLDISRMFTGLFAVYNLVLLLVYRVSAGRLRGWMRRRVGAETYYVVVGAGPRAQEVGRQLESAAEFGVRLLAFVDPDGSSGRAAPRQIELGKTYPVRNTSDIAGMLRQHVIDEILFVVDTKTLAELEDIFLLCDEEGVQTRLVVDFFPHVNSQVYLDQFGSTPLLTFCATPHDEMRLLLKRTFDVVASALALLVCVIPLAILMIAVRLTSPGPAIFRQQRCGLNGRQFTLYKLRSMVIDAEKLREKLAHLNERDGPVFKISNDPRLTPIGRFLRRYSLDELPQFWNVLKGDMSFVGPRPAVPLEVEQYKTWQRRRLRMRPGITCLWALHGRDQLDFETWMRLDLEYIDNWSLWLDCKILLQSIPRVLAGRGAH